MQVLDDPKKSGPGCLLTIGYSALMTLIFGIYWFHNPDYYDRTANKDYDDAHYYACWTTDDNTDDMISNYEIVVQIG